MCVTWPWFWLFWSLFDGYCSLPSGYCSLLMVTAHYRSLLLVPTFSMNGKHRIFKYTQNCKNRGSNKYEIPHYLHFSETFSPNAWKYRPEKNSVFGHISHSVNSYLETLLLHHHKNIDALNKKPIPNFTKHTKDLFVKKMYQELSCMTTFICEGALNVLRFALMIKLWE